MTLRRPTDLKRRTVMPTGRVVVFPEGGAPVGSYRKVTVVLPESPQVALAVGPQVLDSPADIAGVDDAGATPEAIAEGRFYQWAEPDPGKRIELHLLPEQWVAAMSGDGLAKLIVIVEYHA